eukprot:gnl/MRDRNA2_/MRDRNA2_32385_c0_seq1.p1 gnl/MRDRNA2_/MRDRNA2_32385_c0~~gnl/MRDRNA2_/MRDRNA2_32385_c0_seq1.p1  ORF type:complete len:776 (+),score=146.15 gnl/MRDRNA2_/MRDRNA2_32385_c0_seq1:229-2556(+)
MKKLAPQLSSGDVEKTVSTPASTSRQQLQSRSNLQSSTSRGELGSATMYSSRSRGELSSLHEDKPVADERFINEVGRIVGSPSNAHRIFPRVCSITPRAPKLEILKSWPEVPQVLESCGYNVDFEFGMRYEVDRFLGGKVPLGNRLDRATERMWLRKKLVSYPCATIQLRKALRNNKLLKPELATRFAELLAAALEEYEIKPDDVLVEKNDGNLCCTVPIKDESSLGIVMESLIRNIRDPLDPTQENKINEELKALLTKAGAIDNEIPEAMPQWHYQRIETELKLEFPEYGLDETQFDQLRLAIVKSWESYREVWKNLVKKEPEAAEALARQPSLASFSGEVHTVKEGRMRGLTPNRANITHDAESLPFVMEDAEMTQSLLKLTFAPNSEWGSSKLNDFESFPIDAECRNWKSGADHIAPYAVHHDPGLMPKKQVLATARLMQCPYEAHPPVKSVLNISHLRIVFDSLKNLNEAVERITKQLDVLWLDNKFGNPSSVGFMEVRIGLRMTVKVADTSMHSFTPPRVHVCEVRLQHAEVPDFHKGNQHYENIQSILLRAGIHQNHLSRVSSVVMDAFDCTHGKAASDAVCELQKIVNYVKGHSPKFTLPQRRVAEKLVDGLVDQCLDVGNEPDLISVVGTVSPIQRKRALRKLDHDREIKHGELGELLKKSHKAFGKLAFEVHWSCPRTPLAAKLSRKIAQTLISAKLVNKTERLLGSDITDFQKVCEEKMRRMGIHDLHTQVEDHLERLQNRGHQRSSITGSQNLHATFSKEVSIT